VAFLGFVNAEIICALFRPQRQGLHALHCSATL
jgi:hypothetical protein